MIFLQLFLTFLKIGAVSFGGGYGMIALLKEEVISHGWMSSEELLNFIAVSESTPGPIAINMATFVGFSQGGMLGAILSTLGVVLPAFLIILLISAILSKLIEYAGVKAFLSGVRPVVIGLIVGTGILLTAEIIMGLKVVGDPVVFNWKSLEIFGAVALIYGVYKFKTRKSMSPIILIIVSAVLGIVFYGIPLF